MSQPDDSTIGGSEWPDPPELPEDPDKLQALVSHLLEKLSERENRVDHLFWKASDFHFQNQKLREENRELRRENRALRRHLADEHSVSEGIRFARAVIEEIDTRQLTSQNGLLQELSIWAEQEGMENTSESHIRRKLRDAGVLGETVEQIVSLCREEL